MVESTDVLRNRIHKLLSDHGYHVTSYKDASGVREDLVASKSSPYSLIISSYMTPLMKGDEILKNAMQVVPDTQRSMMADAGKLQTLVSAINSAHIHSCLTIPFRDEDLLSQVKLRCVQYETDQKQKRIKKTIQRQNKQLFQIAANYKKEEAVNAAHVEQKNMELRILESRISAAGGSVLPDKPVLIEDILKERGGSFSPVDFGIQFLVCRDQIKQIIEAAVPGQTLSIRPVTYHDIIQQAPGGYRQLVKAILPKVLALLEENKIPDGTLFEAVTEINLGTHFELAVSKDLTQAVITVKTDTASMLDLSYVKQFLEMHKIAWGVKADGVIEAWLKKATPGKDPFLIAQAREPEVSKDARIRYHFQTNFLHAGKVNDDGSINFKDRGEIPHVEENAFLAVKILPEAGVPGVDVMGRQILVEDPSDLTFSSGFGTRISEDGTKIYAAIAGQPHLDAMGNVSVYPEYQIKGDLGFETGDVKFDGNVIVNGSVKQGFKVVCASLTAKEIHGAHIDISGDLNVADGIVDTKLVKVKGSVQARFIRNSTINAFGDLIIQKEIIDSTINLSGACINENGSIINSQISAKMGIRGGSIGNKSSKPLSLTVGVDDHINLLVAKVDAKLNMNNTTIDELKSEILELEKEEQALHGVISNHAYVQDRSQLTLKGIEKKMANLKASGNMAVFQKVSKSIEKIREDAKIAVGEINKGFNRQDEISLELTQKKGRIKELEDQNRAYLDEKKRLLEFSDRNEPLPEVKAAGKIQSETRIFAANSSKTLYHSSSRCRIREHALAPDGDGGILFYEMRIENF